MTPRAISGCVVILVVSGCATVDGEPAAEAAPEVAPRVAVVKPPPPIVTPASPPVSTAPVIAAPSAPRPNETEALVAEFAKWRKLSPAELAREQETARQAFNQSRNDNARVKLAMALALPGAPASDDGRALELLDPLVKTPGAALHSLAVLLASYVQEQRRLNAQVAGMQQNLQGLQQNVQGLQQKLDAIKTLERSLSGRGESGTVRRR